MSEVLVSELFQAICPLELLNCLDPRQESLNRVEHLAFDSRQVRPGTVFIAVRGAQSDGHNFLKNAWESGASALVIERGQENLLPAGCSLPVAVVENSRLALSRSADVFYGKPSSSLQAIGVTGTNGKTSVTWLIANMLSIMGRPSGIVGTLGKKIVSSLSANLGNSEFESTANTSPDPLSIHEYLRRLKDARAAAVAIEVTSQGVAQDRTSSVAWDCAVFTNLTRDHLDLHGTLEEHGRLKEKLFTEHLVNSNSKNPSAIVNLDDEYGRALYAKLHSGYSMLRTVGYGVESAVAENRVVEVNWEMTGSTIQAELSGRKVSLRSRLLGRYNVSNILAAVSALDSLGYELGEISEALPEVACVPGRLESVGEGQRYVFVDYAHTPDALVNVSRSLRELTSGRLITVFGCGGDRDNGKRPLMGKAVADWSDIAVVTSDNPRTEDPESIIEQIIPGLTESVVRRDFKCHKETERRQAIRKA